MPPEHRNAGWQIIPPVGRLKQTHHLDNGRNALVGWAVLSKGDS
jgi:hypothetical protein